MSIPPPLTPAARFDSILLALSQAVAAMSGGNRLPMLMIVRIVDRIRGIKQCFARIARRIAAGSYAPRRPSAAPRRKSAARKPRSPSGLPHKAAWMLPMVQDAGCFRSQLEYLFRDPEMAALLAAAPASLGRPLRSLCHMLGITPPPVVAPPARPRPPRQQRPARPEPPRPPPQPAWMPPDTRRKRWPLSRIRGRPDSS